MPAAYKDVTKKSLPYFYPVFTTAKVIDVYDGDTITVAATLGNCPNAIVYKWKIRLMGIDSPEVRTKNLMEKEAGYESRNYLKYKIDQKMVQVDIKGYDKYGRILADILQDGENMNEDMVKKGHARAYDGGKKQAWFSKSDL